MKMKNVALYLIVALMLLVAGTGCATLATTSQSVPIPDLNKEIENPEMGRIYLVRPTDYGSAMAMRITDNGQYIGTTGGYGFLCWEREPGGAEIAGKAENTDKVSLDVNKGKVYYVCQHIQMGWMAARNRLEVIDEKKGKEFLKQCKPPVSGK
jgi:hypothetical protein